MTSSSAFFIEAAAKTVTDWLLRSDRRYRAGGDDDDGRDGGTNEKLEHGGAPCVAPDARSVRVPTGDLVVFESDRGRKRRSGGQRRAYGAPWVTSGNLTGAPPGKAMCRTPHAGIARIARVRDSGGERGTVLGLLERVKAIVMTPRTEWPAVASESGDAAAIRYVAMLALIPALARLIGGWLIGGYTPFLPALIGAVVAYALTFAVVFAVALVVDLLAPRFGGERSYSNALRLTAYSFTPVWLAGIFLLVPGASFLVASRSLRVLPDVDRTAGPDAGTPRGKALPYVIAVAVCAIALDVAVRLALIAAIGAVR